MHTTTHQSVLLTMSFWESEFFLSLALLLLMHIKKSKGFLWIRIFLISKCLSDPILFTLIKYKPFGHSLRAAYTVYFYSYWAFYALEAIICFAVLVELYLKCMEPLEGLRKLGLILFGWLAAVSVIIAVAVSIGPSLTHVQMATMAVSQFQRIQSLLQLCLLVFVFFIARPLGVTFRHPAFGATIGFSLLAVSDLLMSGWFSNLSDSMLTSINLFHAAALPLALCIWLLYGFMPEPKRVPVALPMTSALLRWNEVCKSLGKPSGHVVVVGNREILDHDMAAWDRALEVVGRSPAID